MNVYKWYLEDVTEQFPELCCDVRIHDRDGQDTTTNLYWITTSKSTQDCQSYKKSYRIGIDAECTSTS